jgi:hypothetical protein
VISVTHISGIFQCATAFDQDIGSSNVSSMEAMNLCLPMHCLSMKTLDLGM